MERSKAGEVSQKFQNSSRRLGSLECNPWMPDREIVLLVSVVTPMKFGDLRGILQYVPQFRGRTFVVALDGAVVASPDFSNILLDLAVLRSLNVKIILVHGAAHQIRDLAKRRGVAISNDDGTGVTDDATLELSLDAITRLTASVMQSLTVIKIRAATANAILAHPAGVVGGIDQCHTGAVELVETEVIEGFLQQEILPVIPSLGYDGDARTLRLNSDAVAMEIACAVKASKIIFLMPGEPDFSASSRRGQARQFSAEEAEELRAEVSGKVDKGLYSKLRNAIRACQEGVQRVHFINGYRQDALLTELFSNEGVGTMVFADSYLKVRAATAGDVDEMVLMMRRAIEDEQLVERSRSEILDRLGDYRVIEVDRNVVGFVALHVYASDNLGELACLYIKRSHEGQGYGRRLVADTEKRAAELGLKAIFALSTQAVEYFSEKNGYRRQEDLSFMPKERLAKWNHKRNAVLLVKEFT